MFKGYIKLKGKRATTKYKDGDLLSLNEVKDEDSYGGVLSPDTILIDVDDMDDSERLLHLVTMEKINCCVIKTTRGKHFYFKNNKRVTKCFTSKQLAIGILADCKVGTVNCYSVLKHDGVDREVIYLQRNERNEFDELPKFLLPIDEFYDIVGLYQGDGRNSKLFSYILILQKYLLNEDIKAMLPLINKYMFNDPMDVSEVEKIMRDDAFNKVNTAQFFKDNSFLFAKFSVFLAKQYKMLKINRVLHIYDNGIYVADQKLIERKMIEIIPTLNRAKRKEVLEYLELLIDEEYRDIDNNIRYIAFNNGIYDIIDQELKPFNNDVVITNRIHWNYEPFAYSDIVDETMNKLSCNNKNIRMLMEELAGYCFYRRNELGKAFILIGDKSNGKSTFLDMVKTMLAEENISSLDLKELGERFKTAELLNKLANIGDDIEGEFVTNTAVFKKLVTGDRLNAERKGQDPFDFNSYAKLIFSANTIPKMKDKTGAVLRRLVIIPFNATFSKNSRDYDPYIKYKLREQEAMEYFIKIALKGLQRVLLNNGFTTCEEVERELDEYSYQVDPIKGWIDELREDSDKYVYNQSTKDVYNSYNEYCISNGLMQMSNIEVSRRICKEFGVTTVTRRVNGKRTRLFVRAGH